MSESELHFGKDDESQIAAKLRVFAETHPESVVAKVILQDIFEKRSIQANPRRYIDLIAQDWVGIRIEHFKKEEHIDRLRRWMQVIDPILVERVEREVLIKRLFEKAGFFRQSNNTSLKGYAYDLFAQTEHPIRYFLNNLPGDWRLGPAAYTALDMILDLYGYNFSNVDGLGFLLVQANKHTCINKDETGNLRIQAIQDVLNKWYSQRKPT